MTMMPVGDRPRVLQPGLMMLAPGTERYVVHGGAATVVSLHAGDTIEIVDPSGRQQAEVAVFGADGASDPGILGLRGARPAVGLQAILGQNLHDARRVQAGLSTHSIELQNATAAYGFEPDSPAGTSVRFVAGAAASCVVGAIGVAMSPHDQDPPTDLIIFVHRSVVRTGPDALVPVPLADPAQDFRVERRTAQAYEVKAGQYIQILDIEGRECSDLQCFDARALDNGDTFSLDATFTRTNMGRSFLGPGCTQSSTVQTCSRSLRWCKTPQVATTPSTLRAPPSTTKRWATQATPTAPTTSTASSPSTGSATAGVGSNQFLLQHPTRHREPNLFRRALVPTRRLRLVASPHRSGRGLHRVPVRHRRGQRLEPDRHPGSSLRRQEHDQESDGNSNDC